MTEQYVDPTVNPDAANAAIASVLSDDAPAPQAVVSSMPRISPPPAGSVRLLAGVKDPSGKPIMDVEVDELTGADEERIVKVRGSNDLFRYLQVILECGVTSVGGKTATVDDLKDLLIGDRDYLLLKISEATYGNEIELGEQVCEGCEETFDLKVKTDDIPIKDFDGEFEFDVPLRKGGSAHVRLATGDDQEAFLAGDHTDAERNTVMLSRVVLSITEDGEEQAVSIQPSLVRDLGITDRQKILRTVAERQPGPQYDEVVHTHDCGKELPVGVGLMSLFPGL